MQPETGTVLFSEGHSFLAFLCLLRYSCRRISLLDFFSLGLVLFLDSVGSILENAKLTVNVVPGLAECEACDEIFNVVQHKGFCPNCGSFEKTVLSGKDFTVREIVVPET